MCISLVNDTKTKNWICHEPFEDLLKYCLTMFMMMSSRKVETEYKIVRDGESVQRVCTRHDMTFWQPDDSSAAEQGKRMSLNLQDVPMFHCPLSKMDLKFPKSDEPHEVHDFYITEGRNNGTVAVLRNSTNCDNICLTNMYRAAEDFVEQLWLSLIHI